MFSYHIDVTWPLMVRVPSATSMVGVPAARCSEDIRTPEAALLVRVRFSFCRKLSFCSAVKDLPASDRRFRSTSPRRSQMLEAKT